MNLKHLETFLQIVDKGSFAAAAEALHTTQSTVSTRMKDLEHYFGVGLFDRSAHRARLTPKGWQLYDMSQQIVTLLDQLRDRLGDRGSLTGTLRLGAVGLVAGTWLSALIAELRARHPALELAVEVALTKVLAQRLKAGHLDVAIVAGRIADEALHSDVVGEDRFVWMASPALEVPRRPLGPQELAEWPIVAFPPQSYHHPVLTAWFKAAGLRFRPALTCNSMDLIARLVMQRLGVGLLPADHFGPEISLGRLEVLQTLPEIPGVELTLVSALERRTGFAAVVREAVQAVRRGRG
ncbi:LysR family transcriptional regulator [Aquincola sp. S2]|uniref:LysR family transcriptional regulator n=1 Tax=Pseudaquabacterium terrae TaxID=2732868 RepID=A0ABX2ETM7_9BURK|nr:LysR family transcriptional regulator [Aquabacterium terrae]NRF72064.1 LysR family transcriptional regulator [Aquabacterium terrae]